ncbi:ion transporter [Raineya orbicola]|uniref:Ion transport protein n=1 Tax=Raineya orbicola TaxID=2016530 RepID=A0A2N3I8B7_9BACT|nr:ion transporter [Raineya orbicola]PKQ66561.1 Ion transport protein [Raineya orbicola]
MSKTLIQRIVRNKTFIRTTSIMIITCSILLGIEASFTKEILFFVILDTAFTIYFSIEVILRIFAEERPWEFFKLFSLKKQISPKTGKKRTQIVFHEHGFWNCFDFVITAFSIFSLVVHIFEHPEFLVVGRLFRVLRILRLLEISNELKEVERKIVSIVPTVFSFALLLGVLLYIYSIIGIYLFSHHKYENADFSSLGASFLSLFQVMTLEGWVEMMYQASSHYEDSWWIKGYFISFVILTVIVSFNVFVAVLTSQVQEKINAKQVIEEKELFREMNDTLKEMRSKMLTEIEGLRNEIQKLRSEIQNNKP